MAITKKILISIALFFCLTTPIQAATFGFSSATNTFNQGCIYSLDINLDARGQSTNAADIIVEYDPAKVEIVDSDPVLPGTQIKPGNVYSNYFGNQVDATNGVIRLTGASFVGSFSSTGVFATIQFKPLVANTAATFAIRFTGADPYNSLDSNIADTATSNDLLSSVQNILFNFTAGTCVLDTTPPTISFISPTNNQTGVPANANLNFQVADAGSGVDINTLRLIVNGTTYHATDSQVTVTGNTSLYILTLRPIDPLYPSQSNTFRVNAADFSGNSKEEGITFNIPPVPTAVPLPTATPIPIPTCPVAPSCPAFPTSIPILPTATPTIIPPITEDHTSPQIEFVKPLAKDTIDLLPIIIIHLTDTGSGINLDTFKLTFADHLFQNTSPAVTVSGTPDNYLISTQFTDSLTPGAEYTLTAYVADLNGNGLSQSITVTAAQTPSSPLLSFIQRWLPSSTSPASVQPTPVPGHSQPPVTTSNSSLYTIIFIIIAICIVIALAMATFWLYRQYGHTTSPAGRPLGSVFDITTREPVAGLKVNAINQYNKVIITCFTNVYGIFAADLPPGQYRFLVTDSNYQTPDTPGSHKLDYPAPYNGRLITVGDDFDTFISIPVKALKQPSQLPDYGKLTDASGAPLPGRTLGLKETKFNTLITIRVTDTGGHYRFLVPPGRYQVVLLGRKDIPLYLVDTRHHLVGPTVINRDIVLK